MIAAHKNTDIQISVEPFTKLVPELPALFAMNFAEGVPDKDNQELNPDWGQFVALDRAGALHCVAARHGSKLVGYFINIPGWHFHHCGLRISDSMLIYTLPEYREGTGIGILMLRLAEKSLRDSGVKKMYVSANVGRLAKIMEGMKYRPVEIKFSKWIGN